MEGLLGFKNYFKQARRQMVLNSYYTRQIKDGKSIHASLMDWIFVTLSLTIFFLITIYNTSNRLILSIALTFILIGIYLTILIFWKGRSRYKKISKINDDLATKEIIKELTKYGNRDFIGYVKDLLEKYYETNFFEYDDYMDFIGEINGEIYGVKCFKNSLNDRIVLKDLEHFMKEMKSKNIKEGILITNSYFADEVKEETNYILIDFDQIKKILMEIRIYPTKEEIEELILAKYRDRKGNIKNNMNLYRKDKIYKFILLGCILFLVSYFVSYPLYYRIMAFASIGFGIIIGVYNLFKYLETSKTN